MLEDQPPNANSGVCFRAAFCGKRGAKTVSRLTDDFGKEVPQHGDVDEEVGGEL